MKKSTIVLLFLIILSSCRKNTNSEHLNQNNITGKWYMYKIQNVTYNSSGTYYVTDTISYNPNNNFIQFNTNNTVLNSTGETFNYTISGSILTLSLNNISEVDTISELTQNGFV